MGRIEQRMGIVQTNNRGRIAKRKKLSRLEASMIACAVILSVLPGCIGQAEEKPVEEAPGVTDPDTLNILAYGEPDQLDPATCYDARGSLVIQNLYDRLVGYDWSDTKVISPRLAESWEVSMDGMEYTFYLREDATFHDGSPVTAHAVKYSFDRVLLMNQSPSWMMAQCMDLNSTQVIDEYTVKITLTKPYAAFLPILCYTVASIVNPTCFAWSSEIESLNQNDAGSGPYELVEWIPNERIVLIRYDDYWRGPAKLPNVKMSFIPEVGTRVMYLKKGDADIATGFPETNIPDILGAEGVEVFAEPSYDITFIVLGCRGLLADKNVRQAVCMAADYNTILQFVYHGYSERLYNAIPEGMFGWHDIAPYEFDLDGANELLDDAGYIWDEAVGYRRAPATGEILGAEIAVPQGDEVRSQISLLWQSNLGKIGFKLEIREISWAMMYQLIRNEETDMIISGWLPDYADPDNYVDSMCGSANAKAIWGSDYKNEKLDALIDQAKWEADPNVRNDLYYQILTIIKEDAPFVWLAQTAYIEVHRTWVGGYYFNPCQPMEFWSMCKDELGGAETTPKGDINDISHKGDAQLPKIKDSQKEWKKVALVIDCGDADVWFDYADNMADDATSIQDYLKKNGFDVQRISQYWGDKKKKYPAIRDNPNINDAMEKKFKKIIDVYTQQLKCPKGKEGCHEFFLYINAHGGKGSCELYDPTGSGKSDIINYFILSTWLAKFDPCVRIIIFLDVCNSGSAIKELEKLCSRKGKNCEVIVMTATDDEHTADPGWLYNSGTKDFMDGHNDDYDDDGDGDFYDRWREMEKQGWDDHRPQLFVGKGKEKFLIIKGEFYKWNLEKNKRTKTGEKKKKSHHLCTLD